MTGARKGVVAAALAAVSVLLAAAAFATRQSDASASDPPSVTAASPSVDHPGGNPSASDPSPAGSPVIGSSAAGSSTAGETVGGGTVGTPAIGPGPTSTVFGSGYTLVKNWDFGADGDIRTVADLSREFVYHDQFGTIDNHGSYGSVTLAPDAADAVAGQPVQSPDQPVRAFTADALSTTLVPLNGASTVSPAAHNVGNGSFMAAWAPAAGGSLLGHDILWETRVRYVTPPYFWFALWNSGDQWADGAELDTVESFGFDKGHGRTNFDGRYWHSDPVGGTSTTDYGNWTAGMASRGVTAFDPTRYHVWSTLYRADDSYTVYLDGVAVQSGTIHWTLGGALDGTPIDFHFLFDAGWGHTRVATVDHSLAASALAGTSYQFDYSRVYLR